MATAWWWLDRKSTRLNSSHLVISYAVFCLKKKKKKEGPAAVPPPAQPNPAPLPHVRQRGGSVQPAAGGGSLGLARGPVFFFFFFFKKGAPPEIPPFSPPRLFPI